MTCLVIKVFGACEFVSLALGKSSATLNRMIDLKLVTRICRDEHLSTASSGRGPIRCGIRGSARRNDLFPIPAANSP